MSAKKKATVQVNAPMKQANDVVETGLVKLRRLQHASLQPIKSDAEYALRGVTLREAQALIEAAEEERTKIVKPINDGVKNLNEFFRKLTAPAKEFVGAVKNDMLEYQEKRAEAEREKAEKEAKKLEKKSPEAAADLRAAAEMRAAPPAVQGIETRKMWTFEIENEADIPREFLMVDEQKLRKYAVAMKDTANVKGVRFFEKSIMAASAS